MKTKAIVASLVLLLTGCGTIDIPCAVEGIYKDIVYPLPSPTPVKGNR